MKKNKLKQHEIFLSEGDNWFKRNKFKGKKLLVANRGNDQIVDYLKASNLNLCKVFEVGCSNGWRLDQIKSISKADCYGIEPSGLALEDGRKRYEEKDRLQLMKWLYRFEDEVENQC